MFLKIKPTFGLSYTNSTIFVVGENFKNESDTFIQCIFGDNLRKVPATYVSDKLVICEAEFKVKANFIFQKGR